MSKFTADLQYKDTEAFNPDLYQYDFTYKDSPLLKPIKNLKVSIILEDNRFIHLKIIDKDNDRWENPFGISENYNPKNSTINLQEYGLNISSKIGESLEFSLSYSNSNGTKEKIFDTSETDFLYCDTFIGFAFRLSSDDVFGFGERMHDFKLGKGKFTLWPNDTSGIFEDKGIGGANLYGLQPLALHRSQKGTYLGLLFNNINAQDVVIKEIKTEDKNNILLDHRTIGGIIDYYFYIDRSLSNDPDDILKNIHELIGFPPLPPFWSLGFHYSKWGHENDLSIQNKYKSFVDYEIPIDCFWADIDILDQYRIFTLSPQFSKLPSLLNEMHNNGYRFVPIIDLAFAEALDDEYYKKGAEEGAFILSSYTDDYLVSNVWPGRSVFPDFFTDAAVSLWEYGMKKYYEIIKYDGIWLDMNEPAMLMSLPNTRAEYLPSGVDFDEKKNPFEKIPYVPGFIENTRTDIRSHSISENAYSHEKGKGKTKYDKFLYTYNFKPLISLLENKNTYYNLIGLKKRPFILTRSTTLGSSRYSFHWLGDNYANFESMKYGLHGAFSFQIYGIPMIGDDICGFSLDSSDSLCARWMALGSFYPFSRNHKAIFYPDHEPFSFEPNSLTLKISLLALKMRYSLLRYYYTELFKISLGEMGSFFKPAFFYYGNDNYLYKYYNESAMIGNNFILFPIFRNSTEDIQVHFPNDDFNEYLSGKRINFRSDSSEEKKVNLTGDYNTIHLYLKGGTITPMQDTINKYIPNTHFLKNEPTEILINPDSVSHLAYGEIIFDDDSYDTLITGNYFRIKLNFIEDNLYFESSNKFTKNPTEEYQYPHNDIHISKIKYYSIDYLFEKNEFDMARITLKNGRKINCLLEKLDKYIFVIDIKKYRLKAIEISSVKLFENNP